QNGIGLKRCCMYLLLLSLEALSISLNWLCLRPLIKKCYSAFQSSKNFFNTYEKGEVQVRNRLTIWIIIILLLVISSPGLINRWSVEVSNNNYELVAPYEEIYEITK